MRVCEYLPIAVAEYDENGSLIEVDLKEFDHEMASNTQEELDQMLSMEKREFEEYKINKFYNQEIDIKSLLNIKNHIDLSLDEANDIVKSRIL